MHKVQVSIVFLVPASKVDSLVHSIDDMIHEDGGEINAQLSQIIEPGQEIFKTSPLAPGEQLYKTFKQD